MTDELKELVYQYGDLMLQAEVLANKIKEVKMKIVNLSGGKGE